LAEVASEVSSTWSSRFLSSWITVAATAVVAVSVTSEVNEDACGERAGVSPEANPATVELLTSPA